MPASQLPFWVQVVQALGPTFIAIAALAVTGYFAWCQWATSRDKLRFDLFEKRLRVYEATRALISKAALHGQILPSDIREFNDNVVGSEFLFNDETRNFFMTISTLCWKAGMARISQDRHGDSEYRSKLLDEEEKLLDFVRSQGGERLEAIFRPYLDVSRVF